MEQKYADYPARYSVDYPESLSRLTTLLRIPMIIPIAVIAALLPAVPVLLVHLAEYGWLSGEDVSGAWAGMFWLPLILMIVVRQKYPRWWFDVIVLFVRFEARIGAYAALLTDKYPSTDEEQDVHLDFDYPDAQELNRFLPIIKWLLLIPHYVVLVILGVLSFLAIIVAWFAILATGRYPRPLFDFVVGVTRYGWRVAAYGFMLITDRYPPFSLKP